MLVNVARELDVTATAAKLPGTGEPSLAVLAAAAVPLCGLEVRDGMMAGARARAGAEVKAGTEVMTGVGGEG